MRVLIADDHAIVRRGVKAIITHVFADAVCDEAEDGHQTLELVQNQVWDLLILDLAMPGLGGIDVLTTLRTMPAPPRVLVVSIYGEGEYAKRALMAGARGYMEKESGPEELIRAVRKVIGRGGVRQRETGREASGRAWRTCWRSGPRIAL